MTNNNNFPTKKQLDIPKNPLNRSVYGLFKLINIILKFINKLVINNKKKTPTRPTSSR